LSGSGLGVLWHEDGHHVVFDPNRDPGPVLPWLRQTGVLAGFDAMLPLSEEGPVTRLFEQVIAARAEPIRHHYIAAAAEKDRL